MIWIGIGGFCGGATTLYYGVRRRNWFLVGFGVLSMICGVLLVLGITLPKLIQGQ